MTESSPEQSIARDIHDALGQALVALRFEVRALARQAVRSGTRMPSADVERHCESLIVLLDEATDSLRRIVEGRRRGELEREGVAEALAACARRFEKRTGIDVDLLLSDPPSLGAAADEALLRILQEALTNVARHSAARRVRVTLKVKRVSVVLEVTDDGRGSNDAWLAEPRAVGLRSMRERIRLLGGRLRITTAQNAGFTVRVELPIGSRART